MVSVHQNGFQPICAECPFIIYQERESKIGPECFLVLQSWTLLKPKNGRQMQPSSRLWFHSRVEKNSKLNANEYVRRRTPLKKESSRIGAPISAIHLFSLRLILSSWTPVWLRLMRYLLNAVCKCCLFISADLKQIAGNTKQHPLKRKNPVDISSEAALGFVSGYCENVFVWNGNLIKCFEIYSLWRCWTQTGVCSHQNLASWVHRQTHLQTSVNTNLLWKLEHGQTLKFLLITQYQRSKSIKMAPEIPIELQSD